MNDERTCANCIAYPECSGIVDGDTPMCDNGEVREEVTKHCLTVRWCSTGQRGIFCDAEGHPASKDDAPWLAEDWEKTLGPFWLILNPQSREYTEAEIATFTRFRALAEYSYEYGIAIKPVVG